LSRADGADAELIDVGEITKVVRHDVVSARFDRQLQQQIVGRIAQEGPPQPARGSILTAEVLIPLILKQEAVLLNQVHEGCQLRAPKPCVRRQGDWREPEPGVALGMVDVNVRRLLALVAEEEEPVASNSR